MLEIVVEQRELAHRVIQLEHRHNKCQKRSRRKNVLVDRVPAHQQQQRNGDRAENIHQRRADRERGHQPKIRTEQPSRGGAEALDFPVLHPKRLDDPVSRNRFVQNVLYLRELVLPAARRAARHPSGRARQ